MESKFYKKFTTTIRECNYDNTYKMAWAKALVEICSSSKLNGNVITITLDDIAYKFLKYYWNQTIFFDLIQGSNPKKPPIILSLVKFLINNYYLAISKKQPEVFEKVEDRLENLLINNEYKNTLNNITNILKKDVSWRFDNIQDNSEKLYEYTQNSNYLKMKVENVIILKNYEQDLYDLINYKWSLILESFNTSPRINKKVRIIDERSIKRSSLNKFKQYLNLENPKHYCFVCGKETNETELSIDHVIPWSYMYSDDLWNLVYVCQHCNSIKSNIIPTESQIEKLKDRNNNLLRIIEESNISNKVIEELKLAIDKDYVNKFWSGCKS